MHRGCFGGCAFCTISAHQGKFISSRSQKSIVDEAKVVAQMSDFKGYISDLGGPSANMYDMHGHDLDICKKCQRPSCLHPAPCKNLNNDHQRLLEVYHAVDSLPGIKKSFIGSGVRYDLAFAENRNVKVNQSNRRYLEELIVKHVSGRLKVAPEHTSDTVLNFISSHPACRETDMAELAAITKKLNFHLEQVQDFTPTPMTLASEIYYTGYHPYTLQPVFTAKTPKEKEAQRQYFFWYKKEFAADIRRSLIRLGRKDLIAELFGSQRQYESKFQNNKHKKNF